MSNLTKVTSKYSILSGREYGLEIVWVISNDMVVARFFSENAARDYINKH